MIRPAAPIAAPARSTSRRMRRRVLLHRDGRNRSDRRAAAHRRRRRRFDPGRHPLCRGRPRDGAPRSRAARAGWKCGAGAFRCTRSRSTATTSRDAAMTLATMALFARGTTRLTNIASWRVKETDRIAAMTAELAKLGAAVTSGDELHRDQPACGLAAGHDPHLRRPPGRDVLLARRVQSARGEGARAGAHPRPRRCVGKDPSPTISKPSSVCAALVPRRYR